MANTMPETVYVREEREVGGTLRDWIVTTSEIDNPLAVYRLVSVHPDFDTPEQPERCTWEWGVALGIEQWLGSCGNLDVMRPAEGTRCDCGAIITIKSGGE
jgi:hypothetical protein